MAKVEERESVASTGSVIARQDGAIHAPHVVQRVRTGSQAPLRMVPATSDFFQEDEDYGTETTMSEPAADKEEGFQERQDFVTPSKLKKTAWDEQDDYPESATRSPPLSTDHRPIPVDPAEHVTFRRRSENVCSRGVRPVADVGAESHITSLVDGDTAPVPAKEADVRRVPSADTPRPLPPPQEQQTRPCGICSLFCNPAAAA